MKDAQVKKLIKKDEGLEQEIYLDNQDNPTCGWGHLLNVGSTVSMSICHIFFKDDFYKAKRYTKEFVKEFDLTLNKTRRAVIICMIFQMGFGSHRCRTGIKGFHNMITALQDKDYMSAAKEMRDSKWYRNHVKRAERLAVIMETGICDIIL